MLGWMECRDVVKLRVAAWRGQFRLRLRRGRDGEAGFTLVEMLVVITIIGLIMGLVGPRVLSYLSDSKLKTARIQIRSLSSALDLYHLDNGRYPTAAEGLGALVQKPATATTWNGPYLSGTLVPNDPWGRPYVYRFPGQHGAYDIVSLGPDGREDETSATANVTSWQP
ncbi:type II secretion system major pseudopilin GspG [Bradyrhizobium sp. SZCCHNRI3052]|uniref:type II secretion system major pseudopilin GspG n=1 Tax=Bradyrhizobium sp. SZCCHNRI3052 TaxID=3057295 RepID=UPI002916B7D9|nr:type II secretion system major pseudopilin GspG [Bradyrhizobium sp. SZCCHNRI3052]